MGNTSSQVATPGPLVPDAVRWKLEDMSRARAGSPQGSEIIIANPRTRTIADLTPNATQTSSKKWRRKETSPEASSEEPKRAKQKRSRGRPRDASGLTRERQFPEPAGEEALASQLEQTVAGAEERQWDLEDIEDGKAGDRVSVVADASSRSSLDDGAELLRAERPAKKQKKRKRSFVEVVVPVAKEVAAASLAAEDKPERKAKKRRTKAKTEPDHDVSPGADELAPETAAEAADKVGTMRRTAALAQMKSNSALSRLHAADVPLGQPAAASIDAKPAQDLQARAARTPSPDRSRNVDREDAVEPGMTRRQSHGQRTTTNTNVGAANALELGQAEGGAVQQAVEQTAAADRDATASVEDVLLDADKANAPTHDQLHDADAALQAAAPEVQRSKKRKRKSKKSRVQAQPTQTDPAHPSSPKAEPTTLSAPPPATTAKRPKKTDTELADILGSVQYAFDDFTRIRKTYRRVIPEAALRTTEEHVRDIGDHLQAHLGYSKRATLRAWAMVGEKCFPRVAGGLIVTAEMLRAKYHQLLAQETPEEHRKRLQKKLDGHNPHPAVPGALPSDAAADDARPVLSDDAQQTGKNANAAVVVVAAADEENPALPKLSSSQRSGSVQEWTEQDVSLLDPNAHSPKVERHGAVADEDIDYVPEEAEGDTQDGSEEQDMNTRSVAYTPPRETRKTVQSPSDRVQSNDQTSKRRVGLPDAVDHGSKEGAFADIEKAAVEAVFAWTCETHGLAHHELRRAITDDWRNVHADFKVELQNALPNRLAMGLRKFCKRHFVDKQSGAWSKEEDDMLLRAYAEHSINWKQ
ncbi:RNA polymerase I enhancer binding protein, partial [Teratosphaeriaceae sp. CCFEE 6253]